MHHHNKHTPVLLNAVLTLLDPQIDESYLDLTAGYGGHANAVLARTKQPKKAILVDRDQDAINSLDKLSVRGVRLIHADFTKALKHPPVSEQKFDMILLDLGVSSPHLDNAERGFSFRKPGPLDMRMDQSQRLSANEIINDWPAEQLSEILVRYGELSINQANKVSAAITQNRPVKDTAELANIVAEAIKTRKRRIHPATTVFQALRIAVNDEIGQLQEALTCVIDRLNNNGRIAIISFHSLEDRIVKNFLKEESTGYEARLRLLTKHPIAGSTEDVHNPRARSAKLRAAVKINRKGAA